MAQAGYVYFVGATAEVIIEGSKEGKEDFVTYRAFCELEAGGDNKL